MSMVKELQPSMKDLLQHVSDENDIQTGQTVKGIVINVSKNEVLVNIENVGLGIVRGKEIYNEEYISGINEGDEVEAVVLDLDNELGMIELSFRAIGRDKIWSNIKLHYQNQDTVEAKIRDVNKGGYIIRVQGVDGFLPASLLAPTHAIKQVGIEDKSLINQMKKYVGHTFNVKIISINPEGDTIICSEKAVSDEIAQAKLSKYKIGDIVEGTIVGIVDFGIFIRFDEDLEGLVHISELAWKKVEDTKRDFKVNQVIKAKIVEIDKDNRINLSIKQLMPNPWNDFAKKTKPGDQFIGTVVKIVSYGAIVVNADDIQGLCHISQISSTPLESPAQIHDFLKVGQQKEFTVLAVDSEEKLYLTLLDLTTALKVQEDLAKLKEKMEEEASEAEPESEPETSKITDDVKEVVDTNHGE